jgi:hypothetical protein
MRNALKGGALAFAAVVATAVVAAAIVPWPHGDPPPTQLHLRAFEIVLEIGSPIGIPMGLVVGAIAGGIRRNRLAKLVATGSALAATGTWLGLAWIASPLPHKHDFRPDLVVCVIPMAFVAAVMVFLERWTRTQE